MKRFLLMALATMISVCTVNEASAQSYNARKSSSMTLDQVEEFALIDSSPLKGFFAKHPQVETLAEILSPEELEATINAELGESISTGIEGMLWKSSVGLKERLQVRIDKSQAGQSPTAQRLFVYLDGQLLYVWKVSTGRERQETGKSGRQYFSSTPVGSFKIQKRARDYFSTLWEAPMPYAQFFDSGVAVHATTPDHYNELGRRASGGCVRLHPDHAAILWKLVDEIGVGQTAVVVTNSQIVDPRGQLAFDTASPTNVPFRKTPIGSMDFDPTTLY